MAKRSTVLKLGILGLVMAVMMPLAVFGGLAMLLSIFSGSPDQIRQYCLERLGAVPSVPSGQVAEFDSTEQRRNAALIISIGAEREVGRRGVILALMVAMQESRLRNLAYGDLDSLGLFQQRPSQGWGTPEQILDPVYAINKFYDALDSVSLWDSGTMTYLDGALAVQHPSREAYLSRDNYFPGWEQPATQILMGGTVTGAGTLNREETAACQRFLVMYEAEKSQIDVAVNTYLEWVGDDYRWTDGGEGVYPGAAPLSEAFRAAGITLPADPKLLASYEGMSSEDVSSKWIPASEFGSGKQEYVRGDILVYGDSADASQAEATDYGLYLGPASMYGASGLGEVKIATFNVHGSSHTASNGSQSGASRAGPQAALILREGYAVVGFQELQPGQRRSIMARLGPGWGIWPAKPHYSDPGAHSVNSIIWDKSQVTFVSGSSLPMPYYFAGHRKPRDIPLVQLRQRGTGQLFYVANTHDPAFARHKKHRLEDARQHASDMDRLVDQGFPVFMTGDFNSGFAVRTRGSVAGGKRENLTYCVMTRSGKVMNGYDLAQVPARRGECPRQTSQELGVGQIDHVYASANVHVSDYQVISKQQTNSDHPVVSITAGLKNPTRPSAATGDQGVYVGPDPSTGKIRIMKADSHQYLLGVLRVSVSYASIGLNPDGDWMFPLNKGTYTLTGRYGFRIHPVTGVPDFHNGDDWGAAYGTPLYAMHDGIVRDIGRNDTAWGNYVRIQYTKEMSSCYAHLSSFTTGLHEGQSVHIGDIVGKVGQTGYATGPHLHLTMCTSDEWLYGNALGTVDPQEFFAQVGIKP